MARSRSSSRKTISRRKKKKPYWPKLKKGQFFVVSYHKAKGNLQMGSVVVSPGKPLVVDDPLSMPCGYYDLLSIEGCQIETTYDPFYARSLAANQVRQQVTEEAQQKEPEEKISNVGVKWVGSTKFRTTAYGVFEQGVPKYGLSEKAVEELTKGSFVKT